LGGQVVVQEESLVRGEIGEKEKRKLQESVLEFYFQTRKLDLPSSALQDSRPAQEEFENLKGETRAGQGKGEGLGPGLQGTARGFRGKAEAASGRANLRITRTENQDV